MIANGPGPIFAASAPENSQSAPANLGSVDASGFSALLFLILAAPQPTINTTLAEGDASGNVSASMALVAHDGKVSLKMVADNSAAVVGAKAINAEDGDAPCVAKSTGDSPLMLDHTTGAAEVSSGKIVAPGIVAEPNSNSSQTIPPLASDSPLIPDHATGQAELPPGKPIAPESIAEPEDNSNQAISGSKSDPGPSGLKPGQPIHVGLAADERNEAVSVVDRPDQQLSRLAGNVSLSNIENTGRAVNRTKKSAGAVSDAAMGERTSFSKAVAAKIPEQSEPSPVTTVVRGHISKVQDNLNQEVAEFAIDRSDGLNPGPMLGPQFHFGKPATADTVEADINSLTGDPKTHEFSELGRNAAQPPNETTTLIVRATLPREGLSPAADASASTWRPTVERVTREIVGHVQMNKQEAILQLDPPELGKIKIDLHVEGDKLQARIFTAAHEARSLIENHLQELRQALQANNLDLVDVRIQSGWHGATGDAMQGFPQQQQQQPTGQQEPGWGSGNLAEGDDVEPQLMSNSSTSGKGRVSMWA